MEDILAEINRMLQKDYGFVRPFAPEDSLWAIPGLDSFGFAEMLAGIEDLYGLRLSHEELQGLAAFGELARRIQQRRAR